MKLFGITYNRKISSFRVVEQGDTNTKKEAATLIGQVKLTYIHKAFIWNCAFYKNKKKSSSTNQCQARTIP